MATSSEPENLDRPCRIYAPVGTHGTLLAYLVRRLLENGANSSFVNRIGDEAVPIDELIADPVAGRARAIAPLGAPHPQIALPRDILGARQNSARLDLADDTVLAALASELDAAARRRGPRSPSLADGAADGRRASLRNPADRSDVVGTAQFASPDLVDARLRRGQAELGAACRAHRASCATPPTGLQADAAASSSA